MAPSSAFAFIAPIRLILADVAASGAPHHSVTSVASASPAIYTDTALRTALLVAAISAVAVLIVAVFTQLGNFVLERQRNKNQHDVEEAKFIYQQRLDEAKANREADRDREMLARERNGLVLPLRFNLAAIADIIRPVYVHGTLSFDGWDHYNKKLGALIESPDAPRLLAEDYILMRDLIVDSEYTSRFCQEHLQKYADGGPGNLVDAHQLFMHWAAPFIEALAQALEALGDSDLANEVRNRQMRGLEMEQMQKSAEIAKALRVFDGENDDTV